MEHPHDEPQVTPWHDLFTGAEDGGDAQAATGQDHVRHLGEVGTQLDDAADAGQDGVDVEEVESGAEAGEAVESDTAEGEEEEELEAEEHGADADVDSAEEVATAQDGEEAEEQAGDGADAAEEGAGQGQGSKYVEEHWDRQLQEGVAEGLSKGQPIRHGPGARSLEGVLLLLLCFPAVLPTDCGC